MGIFGILGNFQTFCLRAKKCTSKCKKLKSQCNFKSTRQDLSVGSLILLVQFCLAISIKIHTVSEKNKFSRVKKLKKISEIAKIAKNHFSETKNGSQGHF